VDQWRIGAPHDRGSGAHIERPPHVIAREADHEDEDALIRDAVRANVRASVNHLQHGSELLEQLSLNDGLMVVGAEYSLETGVVTFLDAVQERGDR